MTRSAALLHRIQRHYRTVSESLHVGSLRIDFMRIEDPDRVLDEVAARNDTTHLPYWAELWDSALGVARHLERHFPLDPRRGPLNVLDLGCGMGLAGAVAAALGHRVLLADLESPALLFARLNTLPYPSRIRIRRLDWGIDRLAERFDLILGSDILYERPQWQALESFWRHHLADNGKVVLGEPGRQTGEMFPEWIAQQHWRLSTTTEPVSTRAKPITIFTLCPA